MAGIEVALGIGTNDPLIFLDKNGVELKHGDFILWNPDDDSWLDMVVEFGNTGKLTTVYEIGGGELRLKDGLLGSENPVLKTGNIMTHFVELTSYNDL
jgi:hypothetical protein